jgi:anti-sigma-K factor RskA
MTPDLHDSLQEDLASYALGILDPESAARVRSHLATCHLCREEVAAHQAVAELLPYGLPPVAPPAAAREALLGRVRDEPAPPRAPVRPPTSLRLAPMLGWAAAAVAVVALGWWNLQLRQERDDARAVARAVQEEEGRRIVRLAGSPAAPAAVGQVVLPPEGAPTGLLVVTGLAPLAPNRTYQLWLLQPDQSPVSAGLFGVNQQGEAVLSVRIPEARVIAGFGITEEPAGGSPAPTEPILLAGQL